MGFQLTPVVRDLLIINIIVFLGTWGLSHVSTSLDSLSILLVAWYPESDHFKPWQIVTHMFMHGDEWHILFNMFGLVSLGPPIEAMFGPRKFLFYYLFCGFGALALHYGVQYYQIHYLGHIEEGGIPVLGASGAIFGLLAAYGTMFPNNQLMLMFIPYPIRAKYFVLLYAGVELFLGVGGYQSGVAHFAHVGGALFGFLLIMYWRRNP